LLEELSDVAASTDARELPGGVWEVIVEGVTLEALRAAIDTHVGVSDALIVDGKVRIPKLFISDMDSTMISAECIDELADFAGIKDRVADITERAMRGELDFAQALTERVGLLKDLPAQAIQDCLDQRIAPMKGAKVLVETLKAKGAGRCW
jgi:phosphoserine phosphatase